MVNRGLESKPKWWRIWVIWGDFFIYATKFSFSILTLSKIIDSLLELLTVICFYPKNILKEKLFQENACENSKYAFVRSCLSMGASVFRRCKDALFGKHC